MKRLATLTLLFSLILPVVAQAQSDVDFTKTRWRQIATQAVKNLNSQVPAIREQGLKNAIYLAEEHADDVRMDRAVKRVIHLYETEASPLMRELAVAALESIGTEEAQKYLRVSVTADERAQTQSLIASVISEQKVQMNGTGAL